ncbi:OsmC family protein [Acidobacteria bacterium ACD]|nr:MAG: OsmC family peroxiredoxin [Acidobacteriota bacterium]MCE7958048.1 OsmC family peroxiredoxin [Acidobacteria bacterium ACB2]MDL1952252.1 OsmC family protein [Acidobacteria bacterium ACD]
MSVLIRGRLEGTAVTLVHGPSGAEITTVPPLDNGGDGSRFSPTDLCAASLGACASTILGLYARRSGIPVEGVEFTVEKEMGGPPRRIGRLTLTMRIRTDCTEKEFERLVAAARACPVRVTLGDGVEVVESYERAAAGVPA